MLGIALPFGSIVVADDPPKTCRTLFDRVLNLLLALTTLVSDLFDPRILVLCSAVLASHSIGLIARCQLLSAEVEWDATNRHFEVLLELL
jgi:hypothetical protein